MRHTRWRWFLVVVGSWVLTLSLPLASATAPGVSTPRRSSSAIAITGDGSLLLAVNPDSNTLTLIDTALEKAVAELGVGLDPRTVAVDTSGQRAYVANRGSDSVSVVDLEARRVVAEWPTGDRPYGVALTADGRWLAVAEQGASRVTLFDAASGLPAVRIPTAARPSGLAVGPDGALYVTHLLEPTVTILTLRPFLVYLPLLIKGATVQTSIAVSLAGVGYRASSIALYPDSNLVQSVVMGPAGDRAYVPHTRSNSSNPALTFDSTVFPLVSLVDLATGQQLVGQQFDLGTLDAPGVGLPFDAAVSPNGSVLWVVNAASNDVTVIDLSTRQRLAHIEVGDNPRGIVLSPDGATAYVNNTLAGSISVIDAAAFQVTNVITSTEIPLPPLLLTGKRLFYSSDDPRMARDQWISCNSCHFEGEHDGRTWIFGFAGPRNTTSLMGMIQTYPLRWSGEWDESADGEFANRRENFGAGLIDGELYCELSPADCVHQPPNQGRSDALDALAAYMDSLEMPLSPAHASGEPLSAAAERGRQLFLDPALDCARCHPPPLFTDHRAHDVGTATPNEKIGPAYDTPSLRGLASSAPYFHDGSALDLIAALTRPSPNGEHDLSGVLSESEISELVEYVLALPYE